MNEGYISIMIKNHGEENSKSFSFVTYDFLIQTQIIPHIFKDANWYQYKEVINKNYRNDDELELTRDKIRSFSEMCSDDMQLSITEMLYVYSSFYLKSFPTPLDFLVVNEEEIQAEWNFIKNSKSKEESLYIKIIISKNHKYSIFMTDSSLDFKIEVMYFTIFMKILYLIFSTLLE